MDKVCMYIYIIGKMQWRDEGSVRGRLSLGKFGERLRVGITSGYGRCRSKCILMKARRKARSEGGQGYSGRSRK